MNLSPVTHELLRQRLRNSTVQFAFKKLDGTLRIAIGTTNLSSIPLDRHPLGEERAQQMSLPSSI